MYDVMLTTQCRKIKIPIYQRLKKFMRHYDVIFKPKQFKFCTSTFQKIVFAHTKVGLVQMREAELREGGGGGDGDFPTA